MLCVNVNFSFQILLLANPAKRSRVCMFSLPVQSLSVDIEPYAMLSIWNNTDTEYIEVSGKS